MVEQSEENVRRSEETPLEELRNNPGSEVAVVEPVETSDNVAGKIKQFLKENRTVSPEKPTFEDVKISIYRAIFVIPEGIYDVARAFFSIPVEVLSYIAWSIQQKTAKLEREDELLTREKEVKAKEELAQQKKTEADNQLREAGNLVADLQRNIGDWEGALKTSPMLQVLQEELKRLNEARLQTNQTMVASLNAMVKKVEKIETGYKNLITQLETSKIPERIDKLEEKLVLEELIKTRVTDKPSVEPTRLKENISIPPQVEPLPAPPIESAPEEKPSIDDTELRDIAEKLDDSCCDILERLKLCSDENLDAPVTASDIAEKINLSIKSIYNHCSHLKDYGLIDSKQNSGIVLTAKGQILVSNFQRTHA